MTSFIYLLTALIVGLQLTDYYTTWIVLNKGGTERNPIVRRLMDWFGVAIGLLVAKLWAGGILIAGAYLGWFESAQGVAILILLTVFYMLVVVHNYFNLRKS